MPAAWTSWWSSARPSALAVTGSPRSTASSCWAPSGSGRTSMPCATTSPQALGLPTDRVSVKARSNDGLGLEGTGEAASATAIVLLSGPERQPPGCRRATPNDRLAGLTRSAAVRATPDDTIGQRSMTDNEAAAGASAIQIQAELLAPIRRDSDRRRPRLHRRADQAVRPAAARAAAGAGGPVRRRRSRSSPRVSRRHGQDPQRPQLAGGPAGAGPGGPSQRDDRPDHPQDGDQCPQLGGQGMDGRLRGCDGAKLVQRRRRSDQSLRRDPPARSTSPTTRASGTRSARRRRRSWCARAAGISTSGT